MAFRFSSFRLNAWTADTVWHAFAPHPGYCHFSHQEHTATDTSPSQFIFVFRCVCTHTITMASAVSTAANSRQDEELTELLAKLYTFQEVVGAKAATSEEEKKAKAANVAVMGKGKKAAAKGSRFLELKSTIVDRLKTIHKLLKETKEKEEAGYGGDNAKEIIKLQAEVRENIRQAGDEWNEMDAIYKKEARKKKSKFTAEELEVQSELVRRLNAEIEKVKEAQMRGYAKNRDTSTAVSLNTKALYSDSGKKHCLVS